MYAGVAGGSVVNPGALLEVDDATAAGTFVGTPVPGAGLVGLAFASDGTLYGSSRVAGAGAAGDLIIVDPDTGALVSTVGAVVDPNGLAVGMSDLAMQPGTDVLYGIANGNSPACGTCLYTIDRTTAVATLVGNPGFGSTGGLAFAPNGTLYWWTNFTQTLHTVDPDDASVLSSTPAVFAPGETVDGDPVGGNPVPVDGLVVRPSDGRLFATGPAGADEIVTIELPSGEVSVVGETAGSPADLAVRPAAPAPPVPLGSFLFWGLALGLAAAGAALGGSRRR